MTVQVGDVVELDRLSGGRYGPGRWVVAAISGGPEVLGDMVRLVRKRPDGTYQQHTRSIRGLTAEEIDPFMSGETVRINGIPEQGQFIMSFEGIVMVDMPGWSKPLKGAGKLAIDPSVARVSFWSLVLENRLGD